MKRIKGFTLVELAIVLVVVGIIMTMGIKGKDLVRIANLRKEVLVINRMQAAVISYYGINELPFDNITQTYDANALVQKGFIVPKDLESVIEDNSTRVLKSCQPDSTGKYTWSDKPFSVCLANMRSGTLSTSGEIICSMEKTLDDRTLLSGRGRLLRESSRLDNYTADEYERCTTAAGRELYAFRLVQFK